MPLFVEWKYLPPGAGCCSVSEEMRATLSTQGSHRQGLSCCKVAQLQEGGDAAVWITEKPQQSANT